MSLNSKPILPCAEKSEKAVLGAVLLNEKYLGIVLAHVRIEDFALTSHQKILRAVISLKKRQRVPDLLTVVEELEQTGNWSR